MLAEFFASVPSYLVAYDSTMEIQQNVLCDNEWDRDRMTFFCPAGAILTDFPFVGLTDEYLHSIRSLQVIGIPGPGPLKSIPSNICRLTQLNMLILSFNQITNIDLNFSTSCLPYLRILDLRGNYISEISVRWLFQLPFLLNINLSRNRLRTIPYTMFNNISNVAILDVSFNQITTFELWLTDITQEIDLSNNPITRFTNDYRVDFSTYGSNRIPRIHLSNTSTLIYVDDAIFEMYNRCSEINSTYPERLTEIIKQIHERNRGLLRWNCSCESFYLQKLLPTTIICPSEPNITCSDVCHYHSSSNPLNVTTRLCHIKDWIPNCLTNSSELDWDFPANYSTLEKLLTEMYNQLSTINLWNDRMAERFVNRIDRFTNKLNNLTASETITEPIRIDLQNITSKIETLLESINTTINITLNTISILSSFKNSSIHSYSQINGINQTLHYSIEINHENLSASITIDPSALVNLSGTDIYTFYYLPSSLFQHTQKDKNKIIVSPIVGIYLPKRPPSFIVNMSFTDIARSSGRYSCEFWQFNEWSDRGCYHSKGFQANRHICICNHTTSFALIFIPDKPIHEAYIPSIVIALVSIVCFCISIILSICRQSTSFRHLSMANIFTSINSILFFILLTVILIHGYRSSNVQSASDSRCSRSQEDLVIATYFFLIATFASKTLLGIYYFLTIFFHYIYIQFTSLLSKRFYASLFIAILLAIIPTIIIRILLVQTPNLVRQYEGICWFNTSVIFPVISIPILIFISLNTLMIFAITFRLCQFISGRQMAQTSERRMIISMMIWLSLCVSLGVAWIFGPFLSIISTEKNRSFSVIVQWIFALFIGLDGVWVLIINVIFYSNQKLNMKNRRMSSNKDER